MSNGKPPSSSDALFRAMADAVPDMLLYGRYDDATAEVTILATNATAREVTGLTEDELVGIKPRSLLAEGAVQVDVDNRRRFAALARELGVVEFPGEVRLQVPASGPRIRIRMVWPDPADTLVMLQVEILRD